MTSNISDPGVASVSSRSRGGRAEEMPESVARFKYGAAVSGILLVGAVLLVSCTQPMSQHPSMLLQGQLDVITPSSQNGAKIEILGNSTAGAGSCVRPQLSKIVLVHGSSWNSVYSFEESDNGAIIASLGHVLLTGDSDVEWKNGTTAISSARQRYHRSAKTSQISAKHSFSSSAVWQVLDCDGGVLAAIKATEFHRCRAMILLDFADCHWESTNFSVHNKEGDHVGSLQLRRHHEFDALGLTDEKGGQHIATIKAIAAKLSTIEATIDSDAIDSVPADPRVLSPLIVKVHQQVLRVENRAAVNSVAMPVLGFCGVYMLFSVFALLAHIGGPRIQGALYVNAFVIVVVAVATLVAKVTLSPPEA
mmetsp:Transcript_13953/g.32846  ORF Transcript_13953/g.32846 Transcript_13953/m.32846 type:complete len:364 (+) Transcript_13953:93-1184(+)